MSSELALWKRVLEEAPEKEKNYKKLKGKLEYSEDVH